MVRANFYKLSNKNQKWAGYIARRENNSEKAK